EEMMRILRNVFGNKSQDQLIKEMETELIKKGKLSPRMLDIAKEILKIKVKVKNKKLTQTELQKINSDANNFINELIDFMQRKELVSSEKGTVTIIYQENKKGQLLLTDDGDFFVGEEGIKKISKESMTDST